MTYSYGWVKLRKMIEARLDDIPPRLRKILGDPEHMRPDDADWLLTEFYGYSCRERRGSRVYTRSSPLTRKLVLAVNFMDPGLFSEARDELVGQLIELEEVMQI